ncbi:MazG-like family protein [Acidobacteriota bacterium]
MMEKHSWDLEAAVQRLLKFRDDRDWKQFHRPKELAAAISIEAAELQELFLWKESETGEQVLKDAARLKKIRDEISDILIFVLLLAHDLEIDLQDNVNTKIEANEARYSVKEHKGVAKKAKH